jgi:hypothetical protein
MLFLYWDQSHFHMDGDCSKSLVWQHQHALLYGMYGGYCLYDEAFRWDVNWILLLEPSFGSLQDEENDSILDKINSMGCDSIYRALQFESLRPFSKISSWSCFTIMKLISSWVSANLPRSKTIGSFEILWFHMLSIRCIFFPIFIMICCSNWGSHNLKCLIFWTSFLITSPSSLS